MFIKKEVNLRLIWIGVGWMEFLQKLQGEQLAALSRHWIMWSGVTAKQARIRMQVGVAELRRWSFAYRAAAAPPEAVGGRLLLWDRKLSPPEV